MKRFFIYIILIALVSGCSIWDRIKDELPQPATPTPLPTLAPEPTPAPTPTPANPMWGYVEGTATIDISNLQLLTDDSMDFKASIFHLYHPETEAWLNVRHRYKLQNDEPQFFYQPKGALDWEYCGVDEINWHHMRVGGNGRWYVHWWQDGDATTVRFDPPTGESTTVHLVGGTAAWREVRPGSGDARIPAGAGATVSVLEIVGTVGLAVSCQE